MPPTRRRRLTQMVIDSLSVENAYFGTTFNINPASGQPYQTTFTATTFTEVDIEPDGLPDGDGRYAGSFRVTGEGTAPIQTGRQGITATEAFIYDISGTFASINYGGSASVTIKFTRLTRVRTNLRAAYAYVRTVCAVEPDRTQAPVPRRLPARPRPLLGPDSETDSDIDLTPVSDPGPANFAAEEEETAADKPVHVHRARGRRRRGLLHLPGDA